MKYIFYAVASRFVFEALEIVRRLGGTVVAHIHNLPGSVKPVGLEPVVAPDAIRREWLELPVVIPLVTPGHRKLVKHECVGLGFRQFAVLVDPTATVASSTVLGAGTLVNAGAVVGTNCVFGRFVQVNRSASIGHDVVAAEYVSFGPNCTVCGSCRFEPGAFVGAGATILPEVTVGRNAVIGAGAVVLHNVAPGATVAGNPAVVVRKRGSAYNNAAV